MSDFSLPIFGPDFEAAMARTNVMRFCVTASRESQSVKPRLSATAPLSRLAPPFRVLKPWTSHGIEPKILAVRISRPEMRRRAQPSSILAAGAVRTCRRTERTLSIIVVSTALRCVCYS